MTNHRASLSKAHIVLIIIAAIGCGDSPPVDPCPNGICAADSGRDTGAETDGSIADGSPDLLVAPNPDGAVPDTSMADSGSADVPTVEDGGGCTEAWDCEPWTTTGTGHAGQRVCVDANTCGTANNRPALTTTLPDLDSEFYECEVEPILVRGCAQLGCHGAEAGRGLRVYAKGRLRMGGRTIAAHPTYAPCGERPSEDCISSLDCTCYSEPYFDLERRRSFDSARGFALDAAGAPLVDVDESDLIRQPAADSGLAHAGVHFWDVGTGDAQILRRWLGGERLGRTCGSNY